MAVIIDYATLQTAIADWLTRDDLTTFIPNFVQNAENKLYRTLNLRNEETALDIPIGGGVAPIPYRFKALKYTYVDGSPTQLLDWRPVEDLYREYPDRADSTTCPQVISREGNHFIFGPSASDGTLKGIYYQKPRSLKTTSETSADELVEDNTAAATHLISQVVTLTDEVHTLSIYAKRVSDSTNRNIGLDISSTSVSTTVNFDLENGRVNLTSGDQFKTAFSENMGSNWYRFSVSFDAAAEATTIAIHLTDTDDQAAMSYTGNATSSAYIWGAQLEISPYPTEIAQTSSSPDAGYKNLISGSSAFSGSSWTETRATVNANQLAGPIEDTTPTQNWYTNNAPEVLLYGSLLEAAPFIRDDPRIAVWKDFFREAVETLKDENENAEVSMGQLRQSA